MFRKLSPVIFALLAIFTTSTFAQFADLPHDSAFVDLGYTADSRDKQYDLTAIAPIYNGWLGGNISQSTQAGVLDAQTIVLHAQNGFRWGDLGIEAFGDMEWNQVRGTNTKSVGGFIRPGIVTWWDHLIVSGGLGSMVENEAVRAELGLTATDPVTLPRALGFISAKWTGVPRLTATGLLKVMPVFAFDALKWSVDVTGLYEITEDIGIAQTLHFERDSAPIVESAGQNWQLKLSARVQL